MAEPPALLPLEVENIQHQVGAAIHEDDMSSDNDVSATPGSRW